MQELSAYPSARVLSNFVRINLPVPIVVLDRLGSVIELNRAARETPRRVIKDLFEPESRAQEVGAFLEELERSGRATAELSRALTGGGSESVLLDGFQVESYFVVMVRQFVDRDALEGELDQLCRVDSLGLLTASLIHDLNNLLTPIVVCSSEIRAELGPASSAGRLAADIGAAAGRAASLVRDVLSFSRARSVVDTFNVNAVIGGLKPLMELLLGDSIELVCLLDENVPVVNANRARLEQSLLNLLANAKKAMPRGGWVAISTARVTLDVNGKSVDHAELLVSDTGVGMSDAVRDRAFDPFFTTSPDGSGLGLASVRRFINESNGQIELDSEPEHGTTVGLYLPAENDIERRLGPALPAREDWFGDETILIVEHDLRVGQGLAAVLENFGYRVFVAESDDEALAMMEGLANAVDLALIDVSLARAGRGVLERLRKLNTRLKTMIVASGHRLRRASCVDGQPTAAHETIARAIRAALDGD
jgi:two-component system, cell cycle sensor histidine kinase and response regulator CckA